VPHIFNKPYTYHINFSSLLITFGIIDKYRYLRKARAVQQQVPPEFAEGSGFRGSTPLP
jgi:hypothetical protein